ncbi:glycosyltransferase family 4 protein [Acinetobacter lwoffii]|uniref:glycosyltransferase family 4 protein n=1 Tax=Acinetobacter lwoffii TaxID=28090 RepID=UPI0002DD63D8|nr:glycosyltransferase family 4 protein [Acinetobacter lwoffii]
MLPKKIILIGTIASSFYGFRADLIHILLKKGHQVYAFTSEYTTEDLMKIEKLGAIPVTYTLDRGGLNPLADIVSTYKLAKKIQKIKPDLVFSYFSKPVIFGTIAAKLARVPQVIGMLEGLGYTFTEQPEGLSKKIQFIKKVQVLLYKIALPQLNKLIFLNSDDPKDLLEQHLIKVKNVEVLGGIGLNLDDYPYEPIDNVSHPIKFLFIGRLLKEKGIYDFVDAAKIVKQKYSNASFIVLGGIDKSNLGALKEEELEDLINSDIIDYPGQVNNVSDWIARSHVFVLPSYREGFPRSTQEAMAVGRPIITTNVPGCRETVADGVNGFLVPKWNAEALAQKMIYLIEHSEVIPRMGMESYKIAKSNFDANKVNEKLLGFLKL